MVRAVRLPSMAHGSYTFPVQDDGVECISEFRDGLLCGNDGRSVKLFTTAAVMAVSDTLPPFNFLCLCRNSGFGRIDYGLLDIELRRVKEESSYVHWYIAKTDKQ